MVYLEIDRVVLVRKTLEIKSAVIDTTEALRVIAKNTAEVDMAEINITNPHATRLSLMTWRNTLISKRKTLTMP
jgi:hypothetical protein